MRQPDLDLIIVDTGVAGCTAVEETVRAGLRTALVDRREIGGTCAHRGCESTATSEIAHMV